MKKTVFRTLLFLAVPVVFLLSGMFSVTVLADDFDHEDPNDPYIATDFLELREFFNKDRSDNPGRRLYIKLGCDIEYQSKQFVDPKDGHTYYIPWFLAANATDFTLDLAGHTLKVTTDLRGDPLFLLTAIGGKVTIRDSGTGGKLVYRNTATNRRGDTVVLKGHVTVESGTIVNASAYEDGEYIDFGAEGAYLKMTGGVIESWCPVLLEPQKGIGKYTYGTFDIDGGKLKVAGGDRAIQIRCNHAILNAVAQGRPDLWAGSTFPTFTKFDVERSTSLAGGFYAFFFEFPEDPREQGGILYTALDEENWWKTLTQTFGSGTVMYVDGKYVPDLSQAVIFEEVSQRIKGPLCQNDFSLYPLTIIDEASVTVSRPNSGELPSYTASVPSGKGYLVDSDYSDSAAGIRNGVAWTHQNGSALAPGETFEIGQKYHVLVFIKLLSSADYNFAEYTDMTVTVNGKPANVIPYSFDRYGVYYTFDPANTVVNTEISIPSMGLGDRMMWSASVPEDADYKIRSTSGVSSNGVLWYKDGVAVTPGKTVYFEAGTEYRVAVFLEVKDAEYFRFAEDDDLSATVNGMTATATKQSDTRCTVSYTFTASEPTFIYGDANGDGNVTALDIVRLKKYLAAQGAGGASSVKAAPGADVDGSGVIDALDAVRLKRYFAEYDPAAGKSFVKLGA